jgi:hypothetical protein
VTIHVLPVVACALDTEAELSVRAGGVPAAGPFAIKLLDNRPTSVEVAGIPARCAAIEVTVRRLEDSSPFGFDLRRTESGIERNGLSLSGGTRRFGVNLMAAWLVLWFKFGMAASVALFASTFLGAPTAAAFSLLLYLLANLQGFLREFAAALAYPVLPVHAGIHQAQVEPTAFREAAGAVLTCFTGVFPDLSRFDCADPVVWGRAIPAAFVLLALLYYLAYSAFFWTVSGLVLRRKEF